MNTSLLARFTRAISPARAVLVLSIVSFVLTIRAAAAVAPAPPDHNPPFSGIHVLGDSLSDTGRTAAVLLQVTGTTVPPPPYAPGRFSNGPLWIEYFAPQVRRAYEPLDNFSFAGANTGNLNVFPGLPGMFQQLQELIGSPAILLDPKALYVVFGGANDFFRIFEGAPPLPVVFAGVANVIKIVDTLQKAGAEHIVVVDLPDIGRTPRALAGGQASAQGATQLSMMFNGLLNQMLNGLPRGVVRVSMFDLLNDMVAHPYKYGFSNVTSPGIFNLAHADTHLFWDDIHPTTRTHQHVADAVFHALARAGLLAHQAR
jgi:phospholipase/lecithinase/hemolysin